MQERTERLIDLVPLAALSDRRATPGDARRFRAQGSAGRRRQADPAVRAVVARRSARMGPRNLHAGISRLASVDGFQDPRLPVPVVRRDLGPTVSLPLFDSMAMLGADLTRMRIRDAIDVLGGVSKKLAKKWEKEFRAWLTPLQVPPNIASLHDFGAIAQLGERLHGMQEVDGSIPSGSTNFRSVVPVATRRKSSRTALLLAQYPRFSICFCSLS